MSYNCLSLECLLMWFSQTGLGCQHVLWREKAFEWLYQLVLFLWIYHHSHIFTMRWDNQLYAPWLSLHGLQLVIRRIHPKSRLILWIKEVPFLQRLTVHPLHCSVVHPQWRCGFHLHAISQLSFGPVLCFRYRCAEPATPLARKYQFWVVFCQLHTFQVDMMRLLLGFWSALPVLVQNQIQINWLYIWPVFLSNRQGWGYF